MPTLVIQRLGDRITLPYHGRYLAEHITGARYFEQPGDHSLRFASGSDSDALFGEIAGFLAGVSQPLQRAGNKRRFAADRAVARYVMLMV